MRTWKADTPGSVPAGARISAGKSGSVDRSFPNRADVLVNWVPVSCMPSPESPAKRMTTSSSFSRLIARFSFSATVVLMVVSQGGVQGPSPARTKKTRQECQVPVPRLQQPLRQGRVGSRSCKDMVAPGQEAVSRDKGRGWGEPRQRACGTCYNGFMKAVKEQRVSLREVNQHLTQYVKAVEAGERIVITRRGKPVALLSPLSAEERRLSPAQEAALERILSRDLHMGGVAPSRDELHER